MHAVYDAVRRLFFVVPAILCPVQFFVDAPFGRFTPSTDSIFLVDGIRAWIAMELVSPIVFVYTFVYTPLATSPADTLPPTPTQLVLAGLFLIHYANRALVSPLRTPSRSKSHIAINIGGAFFNVVNGTLLGTYLRSSTTSVFQANALTQPVFWVGIALWAVGFAGNILHDEVLLNIRRDARVKGKAKARAHDNDAKKTPREHYGIPYGYLYAYISYPNYFCEWVEWFGFALAAAPVPHVTSLDALVYSVHPPWIFLSSEIFFMIARAYRGHQWYLERFPEYPKDRRVVIPWIF